ncbi:MAG: helix-turn-helix domain-containing protein [Hyphomicrobiales bacterium]|nr:helix-turn-helix domain-containing protein [Hyphomicrobiales bacterium]
MDFTDLVVETRFAAPPLLRDDEPPARSERRPDAVRVPRGAELFRAGDLARRLYEVRSGALMLYRLLPDGRRQVVDVATAGDVCGLASAGVHESTCEALADSAVVAIERRALESDPRLGDRVRGKLERAACALHARIVDLGRKGADERVASFLLRLAEAAGDGDAATFPAMTQAQIGDYLGLSLETVCRAFSRLRGRGLVETARGGRVRVCDLARLREAAGDA